MIPSPEMPTCVVGDSRTALLQRLVGLADKGTLPNALALLPAHAMLVEDVIAAFGSLVVARKRMAGGWRRGAAYDEPGDVSAALEHLSTVLRPT